MSFTWTRLQDAFLSTLQREQIPVSMFLVNGVKLTGQVESFDQYAVVLKSTSAQLVYKKAISTIVPMRRVNFSGDVGSKKLEDTKEAPLPLATAGVKSPQVTIKRTRARSPVG